MLLRLISLLLFSCPSAELFALLDWLLLLQSIHSESWWHAWALEQWCFQVKNLSHFSVFLRSIRTCIFLALNEFKDRINSFHLCYIILFTYKPMYVFTVKFHWMCVHLEETVYSFSIFTVELFWKARNNSWMQNKTYAKQIS
jgi:hypothetical protein